MNKEISLPEETWKGIISILATRPYAEIAALIAEMVKQLEDNKVE